MVQYSTELVWPPAAQPAHASRTPEDPQCALVASLSRWHMRWFLALAQRQKYGVESYRDSPVGLLQADEKKQLKLIRITLQPQVQFRAASQPDLAQIMDIHAAARAQCALSNGVDIVLLPPCERIDVVPICESGGSGLWPLRMVNHWLQWGRVRDMAPL